MIDDYDMINAARTAFFAFGKMPAAIVMFEVLRMRARASCTSDIPCLTRVWSLCYIHLHLYENLAGMCFSASPLR